ncbi:MULTISPECIES: hypothetical protein [Morganellaceae]|uniref:Uncharacterized protein n=1 Tax=Morganella psychrotolerans TaxID=368603 RepID=A0A1B8HMK2_9GAMM|nr:hypothetical protein [Morganella psychrotolerans]OBU10544.1 hypothetical protein AYY17_15480 [Morganella psychrotolerans]
MIIGSRSFLINHLLKNFTDDQSIALDMLTIENVGEIEADLSLERPLTEGERVHVLSSVVENYDVNTGAGFDHVRNEIASLRIPQKEVTQ